MGWSLLVGVGTVLRLKRDAWPMIKWLRQATNKYATPTVLHLERGAWSMVKRLRQATNEHPPPPPIYGHATTTMYDNEYTPPPAVYFDWLNGVTRRMCRSKQTWKAAGHGKPYTPRTDHASTADQIMIYTIYCSSLPVVRCAGSTAWRMPATQETCSTS